MYLLECKNVCKKYVKKEVLHNINLNIEENKIYGLFGNNGSGKSTLIKLINDLLILDSGEILFKEKKIGEYSKSRISYLPEKSFLDEDLKVEVVINFYKDFYSDLDIKKVDKLLKKFDIDPKNTISKLSKGMVKKLELILVMSRKADLYILDEPFDGIDSLSRDYMIDKLFLNRNNNSSIIIVTHFINEIENILDEVIVLNNKEIVLNKEMSKLNKKNKSLQDVIREIVLC